MPLVQSLGLAADEPPVIPPPAPCHSFSGQHAGADVHVVCFGALLRAWAASWGGTARRAQRSQQPAAGVAAAAAAAAAVAAAAVPPLPLPPARLTKRAPPAHAHLSLAPCAGKCKATGVDNVGTVPAALTTYLAIQAFRPDIVISTGAAGGGRHQGRCERVAGRAAVECRA